ncbi:MAG: PKD domain-containing protein [Candidatus Auribacterota bacterium]|nr:PKD domain-containing protein [Candidatus Auribacterota bacterium]
MENPVDLGSGGGNSTYSYTYLGGYGGGAVFLNVGGLFTLNGYVRSNGQTAPSGSYRDQCGGGGSGGSINIIAGSFAGTGTMSADGGSRNGTYNGGGGGGGRIAVNCVSYSYSGTISASGGNGLNGYGGAGTVYLNKNGERTLLIKNNTADARDFTNITGGISSDIDYYVIQNATVELLSGVQVTGHVSLNGNMGLYNNGNITPMSFVITGSSNQIYNNAGGYINFAAYNYANTYFKNNGNINIEDKHLQVSSGSTFVATHPLQDTDYDLTVKNGGTFFIQSNQQLQFVNVVVNGGGTITHQTNGTTVEGQMYTVNIRTAGDFTVEANGSVNVSNKGYVNASGPGAGGSTSSTNGGGGGGAYGGDGSDGNKTSGGAGYGSVENPVDLGSGGGNSTYSYTYLGGYGGGAVFLNVGGLFTLNGYVRSNGQTAPSGSYRDQCGGGGSGGSINIIAGSFAGTGTMSADGGSRNGTYNGGGGGGGRIAVNCVSYSYSGTISASGGNGLNGYGGAGTVYLNKNGERTLLIKNNTADARDFTNITGGISSDIDYYVIQNATVELLSGVQVTGHVSLNGNMGLYNNGNITPMSFVITGSSNQIYNNAGGYINFAAYNYANTYFKNNGNIVIQNKILEVKGGSTFVTQRAFLDSDNNLIVRSGGTFTSETTQVLNFNEVIIEGVMNHSNNDTSASGEMYKLNVHTSSDFNIRPGGQVNVSGKGYIQENGPGKGGNTGDRYGGGAGGGYGGSGSNGYASTGGGTYGDMTNPISIGSGGGKNTYHNYSGASGGGAIFLDVEGLLALNGQIVAKGFNSPSMGSYNAAGGPGSGGSIKLNVGAMGGSGLVSVDGGSRYPNSSAGGGGAGRIAIFCPEYYFTGQLSAEGGDGYSQKGGNGTIYLQVSSSGYYEGPLYDMVILLPGETFNPNSSTGKSGSPVSHVAGEPFSVTVIAVDALYNIKTDVTHTVRLLSNQNFAQVLPSQQTFDTTGQVMFSVTECVAATSTVINLDNLGDNRFDKSSATYSVIPTHPAKMQIILPGETLSAGSSSGVSGSPANQIGRVPFNVTVRIVDQYYNKIQARTDVVTLVSSNPNAVIPSFALNDGTATVSITEMELGSARQLTAHVADPQIQGAISALFNVVAGPLKELVVLMPGETFIAGSGKSGTPEDITAGAQFSVTVIAVDDSYNIKTDINHLIQPVSGQQFTSISPASARFSAGTGTLVFTVTHYVANNIIDMTILDQSNHYFDTSTSNYNVLNSNASKLQILLPGETARPGSVSGKTGLPSVELVGVPFYVTVNLVDDYYNPVKGRNDSIDLQSASGHATIPEILLSDGTATMQVVENLNGLDITLTASVDDVQIPSSVSAPYDVFYKIPYIYDVTPSESRPGLTQTLTIYGENFTDGASLFISGAGIDLNSFTVVNENQISANIYIQPSAPVGYRQIILTNPDFAVATGDYMFRVWDPYPPVISNYSYPAEARTGDIITITFDINELLQSNPIVKIDGRNAVFQDNDSGSFTYTYEVTGAERSGNVYVQIVAKDFVGNTGYVTKYMLLDLTPPVVGYKKVEPAVISPNGNLINDETRISFNIYDEHTQFHSTVVIKDTSDNVIKTLWDAQLERPYFRGMWDGKDESGNFVAEDTYHIEATVTDLINNDVVVATIGNITVDYSADYKSYIVFDQSSIYKTVDHDTYIVPVVIKNNDPDVAKSLDLLEVILTDSSVNAYFVENASEIILNAGESATVHVFVDTTTAQRSKVDLILHIEGTELGEVDYSNLRLYISPVPKPDIVVFVKDMLFDPENPDSGQDCEVSVIVKNLGTAPASDIEVVFASFNLPVGAGSVTIPALDIGEEAVVSTTVSFATTGRKLIQIDVDPYDAIDELDEYNNDVSKIIQVGGISANTLSGGIRVLAVAPSRAEIGSLVEITGRADYAIEIDGQMKYDYPVKGGSVTLFIKKVTGEQVVTKGGIYTYGGERSGEYELSFRVPSVFQDGEYALAKIMVTDHTFVGWIQVAIQVYDSATEPRPAFSPGVAHGTENKGDPDIDGDGIPNYYDFDIDGDGIPNIQDPTPYGGSGYYGGSGGGYTGRSNPTVSIGGGYYPRSAGIRFDIPTGSKIYPGTGESAGTTGYQGVSYSPESYPYDAYVHSRDIAFSNDNPGKFEEIYIGAIVWADGGGYKDVPVSFFEIYPATDAITKIGTTQTIPRLYAQRNASVVTSWQNQGDGLYIIEVHLDNEGYSEPDSYTDGNNLNNEASRAIMVGEFNGLLDVLINSPIENMTHTSLRDTILISFEVWRGLDSLAPEDIDILTVMFGDSMAMTRDMIIVKNGLLQTGEYNAQTGVFTISISAPLPAGDPVNGLFPGSIMVAAQTRDGEDVLNGSGTVNINLTLSATPPQSMSVTCSPCDATLTWSVVGEGVSKYNVYRNNELIDSVDHPVNIYTDDTVEKDQTYEYFVMSVDSDSREGIVTSPAGEVSIDKMTPVVYSGADMLTNVNTPVLFEGTITDDGCNDPYTIDWDFGDDTFSSGSLTPEHTYTQTGIYLVTLTVTDEYGVVYTDTLLNEVIRTEIGIDAGEEQTVNEGDAVIFQALITDGSSTENYLYFWDFGDGAVDSGSLSSNHVYADNGQYIVTVLVTDSESNATGEDYLTVNVLNVAPSLTVDSDFDVYEGDVVELISTTYSDPGSADTHVAKVNWGDGSTAEFPVTGGQISLSHIYYDYGNYTIMAEITDDDGGHDSKTIGVTVHRKPIEVSISAEDDLSATISFSGVSGKVYEIWYSDDSFDTFGDSFTWIVAGTVTAVNSNDFGCTYNDDGDPDHPGADGIAGNDDDGRVPPYHVDTRYYRVVLAGSVALDDPWASEDILFYHSKLFYEGRNYAAKIGAGQTHTLNAILDCRFLKGGVSMISSVLATYWEGGVSKSAFTLEGQGAKTWYDGIYDVTDTNVDANNGLLLTVPPDSGIQFVPMVGKVEMADSVTIDLQQGGYNLLAWPYADVVELSNSGLAESGFKGGLLARTSDQIYFWDPVLQRYELPVFYFVPLNEWRNYDQTPCNRKIYPGESILIKTQADSVFTQWNIQRRYIKSSNTLE